MNVLRQPFHVERDIALPVIVAPGEEHDGGGWKLKHQFDKANVELAWFERFVMRRPYQMESETR